MAVVFRLKVKPKATYQRPDVVFLDSARRWGGGRFGTPSYLPKYWNKSRSKMAFDCPGHELYEYIAKFNEKVIDDITGQAKIL